MWLRKHKGYRSRRDIQWLVVGLGNPGPKYERSPHNVGFEVVQRLAATHRIPLLAKHEGMFGAGSIGDVDVAVLMPLTFMNLSGRSVRPAQRAVGVDPAHVIVVHDDADLEFGDVRLKFGGGLAGHNGLRSIAPMLGTNDFPRVRIGVGRPEPGDRRPLADWILTPFDTVVDVEPLYRAGADAVERVVRDGLERAMNAVNPRRQTNRKAGTE